MIIGNPLLFPPPVYRQYATWDPGNKPAVVTLSNMNLTGTDASGIGVLISTIGKNSGKWYYEITINNLLDPATRSRPAIGIVDSSFTQSTVLGFTTDSFCLQSVYTTTTTFTVTNNVFTSVYSNYLFPGDIIGVALDMDNRKITWYINGTLIVTDPIPATMTGIIYPACYDVSGADPAVFTANFGSNVFSYAVPTGYNRGLY